MRKMLVFLFVCGSMSLFSYEHEVAACAIFQNEAPYLKEWIEYHQQIGISHFYLYNHLSEDDWRAVLQPYIDTGLVEVVDWGQKTNCIRTWTHVQCGAYNDAVKKSRYVAKWLAVIDIDEFIVPKKDGTLPAFLNRYANHSGVCINWQQFGTSWIDSIPHGEPILPHLTQRAEISYPRHRLFKSIVRPKDVKYCNSPHYFIYQRGHNHVDANGSFFLGSKTYRPYVDAIQINHYYTRDTHYFLTKKISRVIRMYNKPDLFPSEEIEALLTETNAVEDLSILELMGAAGLEPAKT